MRLRDLLQMARSHGALINVGIDDHHDQPENIEASNTTLSVEPLPGGPGVWDIPVPYEASVVLFSFRAARIIGQANARCGVTGIATRSRTHASSMSLGGPVSWPNPSQQAFYAKPGNALNLSHKVFSSGGQWISLSDAWLEATGPSTRVLRTEWTNYGYAYYTLSAYGEIAVLG